MASEASGDADLETANVRAVTGAARNELVVQVGSSTEQAIREQGSHDGVRQKHEILLTLPSLRLPGRARWIPRIPALAARARRLGLPSIPAWALTRLELAKPSILESISSPVRVEAVGLGRKREVGGVGGRVAFRRGAVRRREHGREGGHLG